MKIEALILDGYHRGHSFLMEYAPIVRLVKPKEHVTDFCCGGDEFDFEDEIIEYKVCFQAVDRKMALYSTNGDSQDLLLGHMFQHVFTDKSWTPATTLYRGFVEPVYKREDRE
jgi:hypothetical protein